MDARSSLLNGAVQRGLVIAGRYVVVDEIGRGGMGVVYRVEHAHTGDSLALKVLVDAARFDPQAVARFKREARTSSRIRSEHVVQITDADTAPELDGSPFIVMELLCGSDLEKYASRWGAIAPAVLVPLLAQVGSVLEAAHRLGIVHRDLKPQNLFLHKRKDGATIAKVLDFGISKFVAVDHAIEIGGVTGTGSVLGTPLFMAPEQAHGYNDKIAPATDVWSMGLVALRLLTGEHYWGEPTMAELMMKIAVTRLIPPSERWPNGAHMSPALDAWFLRSCDRDPTQRWPSIQLQIAELAAAFGLTLPSTAQSALSLPFDVTAPTVPPPALAFGNTLPALDAKPKPRDADPKWKTTQPEPKAHVADGVDPAPPAKHAFLPNETPSPPKRPIAKVRARAALLGVAALGVTGAIGAVLAQRPAPPIATLSSGSPSLHEDGGFPLVSAIAVEPAESSTLAPATSAPATIVSAPPTLAPRPQPRASVARPRASASAGPLVTTTTASTSAKLYAPLAP